MVFTSSILHFCPDFLQWWKYIYKGSVKSNKSFPFPPSLRCLCPVFYHSNKMESKTTPSLLNFWKHATKYKWIHLVLSAKQISHNKNIKSHFRLLWQSNLLIEMCEWSMHTWVVYWCISKCGSERWALGVPLDHFLPCFVQTRSFICLGGRQTDKKMPAIFLSLPLQCL